MSSGKSCENYNHDTCFPKVEKELGESINEFASKIFDLCSRINPDPTNFEDLPKDQLAMTPLELKLWREMSKEDKEAYLKRNYPQDYR